MLTAETLQIVFDHWSRSFLITLVIEVPIFALIVRRQVPLWRGALAGAAGSCLTHPLLWFAWPFVVHDYTLYILSGELIVATVESLTFFALARPIPLTRAIAASFIANAASFGGGILLRLLGVIG